MIKAKRPNCHYCNVQESELKCLYCTDCRKKMAKKEIQSNFGNEKSYHCEICKQEIIGQNQISRVICRKCLDEI